MLEEAGADNAVTVVSVDRNACLNVDFVWTDDELMVAAIEVRHGSFGGTAEIHMAKASPLHAFFEQLDEQWRGFEGEIEWGSLFGDLHLLASHDKVGRVNLRVRLQDLSGASRLETEIPLELGALRRIADALRTASACQV